MDSSVLEWRAATSRMRPKSRQASPVGWLQKLCRAASRFSQEAASSRGGMVNRTSSEGLFGESVGVDEALGLVASVAPGGPVG